MAETVIKYPFRLTSPDDNTKVVNASDVGVTIDDEEKSLQSAIEDGDIGGGSDLDDVLEKGSGSDAVKMVKAQEASGTGSVAEGFSSASGSYSHAEGYDSTSSGAYSHAEGDVTEASGSASHAEGNMVVASGQNSHAEGRYTKAMGTDSHAEGMYTFAKGTQSHAEGDLTIAANPSSHAEGGLGKYGNSLSAKCKADAAATAESNTFKSEVELKKGMIMEDDDELIGYVSAVVNAALKQYTITFFDSTTKYSFSSGTDYTFYQATAAMGGYSHAEGNSRAIGTYSHAEGDDTEANGEAAHAEGDSNEETIEITSVPAIAKNGSTEITVTDDIFRQLYAGLKSTNGCEVTYVYRYSDVNRVTIRATEAFAGGTLSFIVGRNVSNGVASHTEGIGSVATGYGAHVEGKYCVADSDFAHAEGRETKASGSKSHAEGYETIASSACSHAEGYETIAGAEYAHAEGDRSKAKGIASHAEGLSSVASGAYSHAEGDGSAAYGADSHAEGTSTRTNNAGEHAEGTYNASHTGSLGSEMTIHSVGIGTSNTDRKNAHEIMKDGTHYLGDGDIYACQQSQTDKTGKKIVPVSLSSRTLNVNGSTVDIPDVSYTPSSRTLSVGDNDVVIPSSSGGGGWSVYNTEALLRGIGFQTNTIGETPTEVCDFYINAEDGNRVIDLRVFTNPCEMDVLLKGRTAFETVIYFKGIDTIDIGLSVEGTMSISDVIDVNDEPDLDTTKTYMVSIQYGSIVWAEVTPRQEEEEETTGE